MERTSYVPPYVKFEGPIYNVLALRKNDGNWMGHVSRAGELGIRMDSPIHENPFGLFMFPAESLKFHFRLIEGVYVGWMYDPRTQGPRKTPNLVVDSYNIPEFYMGIGDWGQTPSKGDKVIEAAISFHRELYGLKYDLSTILFRIGIPTEYIEVVTLQLLNLVSVEKKNK
ncbi:MAG: hypothetical protein N3E38_01430 [Candidatus Aenigmarchaeota archaeon]|nr:hypothetical protein [Candidatus Aenigmarchaeota archaeon]